MSDSWMPTIELRLTPVEFLQLPRHPSYRYEYINGRAVLSPHPRHFHALLDLRPFQTIESLDVRPLEAVAFSKLVKLFAASFANVQPFASLDNKTRVEAAKQALEKTMGGGDGPLIQQASFIAVDQNEVCGAILITLLPDADPTDWDGYRWAEPPPKDAIEKCVGRPHLTWIFVPALLTGRGIGTALLGRAIDSLAQLGYRQLASTFMLGNHLSTLWHWRNGFRLLPYPGSMRKLLQQKTPPAKSGGVG